jgi:O-antigen/teichoic acid export membrane protein
VREPLSSKLERWLRSGQYLALLNGINAFFPLAASVVLTRVLSQEDYGLYAYFLAFVLLLDFTSLPGLGTAVVQAVARGNEGTLRPATRARLLSSLLGSIALGALSLQKAVVGENDTAWIFFLLAISFPLYFPFTNFLFFLNGRSDFRGMALHQGVHHLLSYLPTVAAALWTRDFRVVLAVHVVFSIVARYAVYQRVLRLVPQGARVQEGYLKFGAEVSLLSLFATLEANLDRIIVGSFFSPTALAPFHIGKNFAYEIRLVWNVAYQYVFPSLARRNETSSSFPRALLWILLLYVSAVVGFMMVVPWIIRALYPEAYQEATVVGRWLLFAILVGSPGAVLDTFFLSAGRTKAVWTIRALKIASYLLGLHWLIGDYGMNGIYYAAVLAGVVYTGAGLAALVTKGRSS